MSESTAPAVAANRRDALKGYVALVAIFIWVVVLVPPFSGWAHRFGYVQAIQFGLFNSWIPAGVVIGAPWRLFAPRESSKDVTGAGVRNALQRLLAGAVERRHGGLSYRRAVSEVFAFVVLVIFWRTTPVVDVLVRHEWLTVVESVTLVVAGVPLWLDLIESRPFRPGTTRPFRIGMSAISMWTVWVVAYILAMSNDVWYRAFHYVGAGAGWQSTDQQLTAAVMWFFAGVAFIPVVFWNLNQWLRAEDDPSEELYKLVRQERHRGFFGTKS